MKLKELLATTPETLAVEQHNALKVHVLEKLAKVSEAIKTENYSYIEKLTSHSSAGDFHGDENDFIEFSFDEDDSMDIQEVVNRLISLKSIFTPNKTKAKN